MGKRRSGGSGREATNPSLYEEVKRESSLVFSRPTSAYRSMWISREYRKRGGKYRSFGKGGRSGKKSRSTRRKEGGGVLKWLRERWVQVIPYLKEGRIVECGSASQKGGKACRPLKRVDERTPITLPELVKLHGKEKLVRLARKKKKDMDGRVDWRRGTFRSSDRS